MVMNYLSELDMDQLTQFFAHGHGLKLTQLESSHGAVLMTNSTQQVMTNKMLHYSHH